jgi:glycosyltransferase involved in cell wall biosynthesis
MQPSVSIILPNLNTNLAFLKERVETIINQTYTDWECIVVDGFSTNGSWEYLKETGEADTRFKCHQFPKEGIYKAWNSGLALAQGTYIYIAPSDDTMQPTLLAKMVGGLQQYPECAIAHCCLSVIDEHGNKSNKKDWDNFGFSRFSQLSHQKHIRYAPHDGILYSGIGTVYTSITQLLIKNEVFEKIGYFHTNLGAIADFEWGMRVALAFNTLHIPEYLATWRIHDEQATNDSLLGSYHLLEQYASFIKLAVETVTKKGLLKRPLDVKQLQYNYYRNAFLSRLKSAKTTGDKLKALTTYLKTYPADSMVDIAKKALRLEKEDGFGFAKRMVKTYQLQDSVKVLPN